MVSRLWSLIFRFMICGFWGFVLRLMVYWLRCFIFGFMISWFRSIIFRLRGFVRFWLFISWLRGFIWFWLFISWLRDCFIGNFRMFVLSIEYREYMGGMVGRIGRCRWGISWFRGLIFRLSICWLRFFIGRFRCWGIGWFRSRSISGFRSRSIGWFRGRSIRGFRGRSISRLRVLVVSIEYREYMRGMVGRVG